MADDDQEKSHDPTQKRLDDARLKGQIPRSQDVLTAAAYAGFLLALAGFGPQVMDRIARSGLALLADPDKPLTIGAVPEMLLAALPLLLFPALPVLGLLIAQRGLIFTADNLLPRISRIDPFAAARQRFGPEGLFDFAKGLVKMMAIGALLAFLLRDEVLVILSSSALSAGQGTALMLSLILRFLALVLVLAILFAVLDHLWQVYRHRVRNRMSHRELRDEHREIEGDPQAKATRRQRGQEIATNRMLADVPMADVIIVNPTHYAVALKWRRELRQPPVCLAKGVDEVAARIREVANRHAIPIQHDPPTARALFATVEIGAPIAPEHYRPVAAALRFAESMRRRARARG